MAKEKNGLNVALLRFIQGFLLGGSGILPGVSGGVLCVVFGIYKPLMEVLAAPVKKAKEHFKMLLPVGVGALTGFLLTVKLLGTIMDTYKSLAECVFVGLIIGTIPALVRSAGKEPRTKWSYISLFSSFTLIFSLLTCLRLSSYVVIPSSLWFCGAGVIFGISIVLPGLSAYTVLEFFGLFEPLLESVDNLDLTVLLPVAIGGASALILLSKLISMLYDRHYSIMAHTIIGIVIATTVPLLPTDFESVSTFVLKLLLMVIGFMIAMAFDYFEKKLK